MSVKIIIPNFACGYLLFIKMICMLLRKIFFVAFLFVGMCGSYAQQVDYSVVSSIEESGVDFLQVTSANDCVCMPIVKRNWGSINWLSNRIMDISHDGKHIAYVSSRNNTTNIFIKELGKQGGSIQRTNRQSVLDFSYSPDGKSIIFSESRGSSTQIFLTDATNGYVCRMITNSSNDYSPIYTSDMNKILFARMENNSVGIWSFDVKSNFLSSYTTGMNPCPLKDPSSYLCTRMSSSGHSEIWKINYSTGIEECVVSDPNRSFTTPTLSPDGNWILFVGESDITTPDFVYKNTDIYVCRTDGTNLQQLTYHAADDLSPVWSRDGKYIYFISQRGSANATANIWRMPFVY